MTCTRCHRPLTEPAGADPTPVEPPPRPMTPEELDEAMDDINQCETDA